MGENTEHDKEENATIFILLRFYFGQFEILLYLCSEFDCFTLKIYTTNGD